MSDLLFHGCRNRENDHDLQQSRTIETDHIMVFIRVSSMSRLVKPSERVTHLNDGLLYFLEQ